MALTNKQRLILNDSIDDVDVFLSDKALVPEFDLTEFIEFKTKLIKSKYNISDAELTVAFLENIDIANEAGKAVRKSVEYVGLRSGAYPSLTDQADMAYWDRQNGTTTLDDAISAVKAEFPKP
jgi:hypothetical protein